MSLTFDDVDTLREALEELAERTGG
jgi:hypothetical protein